MVTTDPRVAAAGGAATPDAVAAASGARLRFEAVTKIFPDGTRALAPTTLEVAGGELVAIVGPSGCGKSTLLRLASGLTTATSGAVAVDAKNVGYVFQDPTLLPWRTVLANVELLAQLEGVPKARRRELALDAIRLTGLTGFERHRPKALSGGMRMRVSLARSLTLKPEIFLFDEPFAALDEITRSRMNDELLSIFVREGFAGVFVTHSVLEAAFLATRVVVMSPRPGRIVAEVEVPFPYPRTPELRYDPEFIGIASRISLLLSEVTG
jgi:NitT/TauT family transport system ATP-binding protein